MRVAANGPKLHKFDAKYYAMQCLREGHQSGGQAPRPTGPAKDEDDDDNDRALEWGSESWLYDLP